MLNVEKVFVKFENDFKGDILEILNYSFDDSSLEDLISFLEDNINDSGAIDERIDSYIDIYYYDLRKWAVDNFEYIDKDADVYNIESVKYKYEKL